MSWIVVGCTLASTVLLPILASIACAIVWLIVARVIPGVSAAGLQARSDRARHSTLWMNALVR